MKRIDRPPTLTAKTAESLREAIMKGDLRPGDPLREVELSKSLETSRGTVREALRLLQGEGGLVDIVPHRGAFVAQLSQKDVSEIYTLRALLEPYAVRLALENNAVGKHEIDELAAMVRRLEELEQLDDYSESIETDITFHWLTCKGCGHKLLLECLERLQSLTHIFILNTKLYRSDMVSDAVSHQAILDGIRCGDPGRAEEIVRHHITEAGASLLRRMDEVNWGRSKSL